MDVPGSARLSVHHLINELEEGMKRKGGNYMGLTSSNLTMLRTLKNHMDHLQDRIEHLEGLLNHVSSTAQK
jgi:hypothetical protein